MKQIIPKKDFQNPWRWSACTLRQTEQDPQSKGYHCFGYRCNHWSRYFSTIGTASADGGPGWFFFLFTAITCSFAAFCYAEFASRYPVSRQRLFLCLCQLRRNNCMTIIGWALIMEYAIGNITVAISWSTICRDCLSMGIRLPLWMQNGLGDRQGLCLRTLSRWSAQARHWIVFQPICNRHTRLFRKLHICSQPGHHGYSALFIIILITWLVYRGMKESRNASNLMVIVNSP